jgi:hypothetical protein
MTYYEDIMRITSELIDDLVQAAIDELHFDLAEDDPIIEYEKDCLKSRFVKILGNPRDPPLKADKRESCEVCRSGCGDKRYKFCPNCGNPLAS